MRDGLANFAIHHFIFCLFSSLLVLNSQLGSGLNSIRLVYIINLSHVHTYLTLFDPSGVWHNTDQLLMCNKAEFNYLSYGFQVRNQTTVSFLTTVAFKSLSKKSQSLKYFKKILIQKLWLDFDVSEFLLSGKMAELLCRIIFSRVFI